MDKLRSPGGCPWDAEQDHNTLLKYLLEESYEFIEAVEDKDRSAMQEELGDLFCMVGLMIKEGLVDGDVIETAATDKLNKLKKWSGIFKDE